MPTAHAGRAALVRHVVSVTRALLVAVVLAGLAGCVSVLREPALPMPERPPISVYQQPEGFFCMNETDFQAFVKWLRKLNEFEAARQRFLAK